ncbi:MAG: HEAT repeat domain-containing protein [Candidatus Dadabacteria bacterium]|nr:MAG: HEAT repeat domain-containing protein [Candidatus Dadabacteria bacterium]
MVCFDGPEEGSRPEEPVSDSNLKVPKDTLLTEILNKLNNGTREEKLEAVYALKEHFSRDDAIILNLADHIIDSENDPQVREYALRQLRLPDSEKSVELLLHVFMEPNEASMVRSAAARRLIEINPEVALAAFEEISLEDPRDSVLTGIDEYTRAVNSRSAVPKLSEILFNEKLPPAFRAAAAEALGRIDGNDAVYDLSDAISDADFEVSRAAVTALAGIHSSESAEALLKGLDSLYSEVVKTAAYGLGQMEHEDARPRLEELSQNAATHQHELKKALIFALGKIGSEESLPLLMDAATQVASPEYNDKLSVREEAIKAIGRIAKRTGSREAIRFLREVFSSAQGKDTRYYRLFNQVIDALGEAGDIESGGELLKIAQNRWADPDTRMRAVYALGKMRYQAAFDFVVELSRQDEQLGTTVWAIRALGEFKSDQAAEQLIELLGTCRYDSTRREVVRALGKTGSIKAVPVLGPLMDDPVVGELARAGLRQFS